MTDEGKCLTSPNLLGLTVTLVRGNEIPLLLVRYLRMNVRVKWFTVRLSNVVMEIIWPSS